MNEVWTTMGCGKCFILSFGRFEIHTDKKMKLKLIYELIIGIDNNTKYKYIKCPNCGHRQYI